MLFDITSKTLSYDDVIKMPFSAMQIVRMSGIDPHITYLRCTLYGRFYRLAAPSLSNCTAAARLTFIDPPTPSRTDIPAWHSYNFKQVYIAFARAIEKSPKFRRAALVRPGHRGQARPGQAPDPRPPRPSTVRVVFAVDIVESFNRIWSRASEDVTCAHAFAIVSGTFARLYFSALPLPLEDCFK